MTPTKAFIIMLSLVTIALSKHLTAMQYVPEVTPLTQPTPHKRTPSVDSNNYQGESRGESSSPTPKQLATPPPCEQLPTFPADVTVTMPCTKYCKKNSVNIGTLPQQLAWLPISLTIFNIINNNGCDECLKSLVTTLKQTLETSPISVFIPSTIIEFLEALPIMEIVVWLESWSDETTLPIKRFFPDAAKKDILRFCEKYPGISLTHYEIFGKISETFYTIKPFYRDLRGNSSWLTQNSSQPF